MTANGSATETTTVLTLTFDKAIEGLAAADIALTAGETGAIKGALTAKTNGVYELAVSGITKGGEVTVAVAKTNYTITPAYKTVTVNYKAASVAVGDFYMKDGTLLPGATILTAEQQADCIGIVYWTGDPTANDEALKAAHPTCTHGLVVALKNAGTSAWQVTASSVSAWVTDKTSYAPIASGEELNDPINKIMGYNNTKAIEAFNASLTADWYKVNWVDQLVAYRMAVPTPANNSGWFVPSMKELTLLCGLNNQDENVFKDSYGTDNRDAINTQLAKVAGSNQIVLDYYWSSTQHSREEFAWRIYFEFGLTKDNPKELDGNIRVVSAF